MGYVWPQRAIWSKKCSKWTKRPNVANHIFTHEIQKCARIQESDVMGRWGEINLAMSVLSIHLLQPPFTYIWEQSAESGLDKVGRGHLFVIVYSYCHWCWGDHLHLGTEKQLDPEVVLAWFSDTWNKLCSCVESAAGIRACRLWKKKEEKAPIFFWKCTTWVMQIEYHSKDLTTFVFVQRKKY